VFFGLVIAELGLVFYALDDGGDLVVHEWRLAADTIPAQQDLRHHRRVHPVPEQMPGQRGDRWAPPAIAKS